MDELGLQGLPERFNRLERENRRLALGLLVIVAVTVALLCTGMKETKPTLRAKQVCAENYCTQSRDTACALLVTDGNRATLWLYDREAMTPATLEAAPASLVRLESWGHRVLLGENALSGGSLDLRDAGKEQTYRVPPL